MNLIGCHGNRKAKLAKKYKKPHLLRSHKGDEAVITLAFTNSMFFLLLLLMCFRCYDNLKFPLTYNGKSENRPLFGPPADIRGLTTKSENLKVMHILKSLSM